MTIAYLIDYNLNDNSGVIQKIKQQVYQWEKQGHKIYLVSPKTMSVYDINHNVIVEKKFLNLKLRRVGTALNLLYNAYGTHKLCEEIEFDMIYMRYRLYMPFINKLFKKHTVIMEINSDDIEEYKLHSKLTYMYNKLTRFLFLKNINAFVSVSDELKKKFDYLNKHIIVIANGINMEEYPPNIREKNKMPILGFIGTPNQPWHGLDKIKMLANYFQKYMFYIIGTNGEDSQNIRYFGYLSQEEATKIINQCDIGIGTLSLYKTGLTEASPLKSRQYLACGVPLIYAYKDTDISDKLEFGLKLENTEKNIEYEKIEQFVKDVFNNKSIKFKAREFAENILDYEKKEEVRLNFFKRVLDAK